MARCFSLQTEAGCRASNRCACASATRSRRIADLCCWRALPLPFRVHMSTKCAAPLERGASVFAQNSRAARANKDGKFATFCLFRVLPLPLLAFDRLGADLHVLATGDLPTQQKRTRHSYASLPTRCAILCPLRAFDFDVVRCDALEERFHVEHRTRF